MNKAIQTKPISQLARRIRHARQGAHLSQSDLAGQIGISDKSISSYEQGRSIPPFIKLQKIAEVTHYPLNYFTDDNIKDAAITQKLSTIERELTEVKRLLRQAKE